ncbi:hypothetical protein M0Q97_06215 [Candidatus Dojkabacteria bacterium]|jgi:intein/homing endonuclease|nr:hypothetical protein [Candidatus Dojkabacteria bacterium]
MDKKLEQLKEYAKIIKDTPYALRTYLKTYDNTQQKFVPFDLFPDQIQLVYDYEHYNENITKKYRQAGVSTVTAAWISKILQTADPQSPQKILVVANKKDTAVELTSKIRNFLTQWPDWINVGFDPTKDSQSWFKLKNGCEVKGVATSKDALRSYTPTCLIFDEAAYIEAGEDFWAGCMASLSTGGKVIVISTPNGIESIYYPIYDQALNKLNDFHITDLRWYYDPRYTKDLVWIKCNDMVHYMLNKEDYKDETLYAYENNRENFQHLFEQGYKPYSSWYEKMAKKLKFDRRKIAQEIETTFNGSGDNVIPSDIIENIKKNMIRPPIEQYISGQLWVWKYPIEGHRYIMGCLPPGEKVLTDDGLLDIDLVDIRHKLVNEKGEYVDIKNKQEYDVVDEDVYEIKVDNTYRKTKFTAEHPILSSKPNLKRNYKRHLEDIKFNDRYWDFNFKYNPVSKLEVGDWIKVPNIYKKEIFFDPDEKWIINNDLRYDFHIESPLNKSTFWWFIGLWLGDGWLTKNKYTHTIGVCFNKNEKYYLDKCESIIKELFNREPNIKEKNSVYELTFTSKELYYFLLENFGHYADKKKIPEWSKYISIDFKKELIKGYFDSDGCLMKTHEYKKINSHISFVSINLELLESIQDILFSLGVISSLSLLRKAGEHNFNGKISKTKITYNLCLANFDSINLINVLNDKEDIKLNKYDINDFKNINHRFIGSCHFDKNNDYIFFRVKSINKTKYTGKVYNFECDTHTFMCHHITTHNCDVSRGDSEDYSAINIIDFDDNEQVLEYIGKIPPDDLATLAYKWGKMYSAFCVIDITGGMGIATSRKMQEFGYKDMFVDGINTKDIWAYDQKIMDKIPGINFNNKRTQIIATFEEQLRHNFIIRSERLVNEANTFVFIGGRPDHMKGCHDDAIMSIAIAMYAGEICFTQLTRNENKNKAMLEAWTMSERSYDPKKTFYSYGTSLDPIGGMAISGENNYHHNNPMDTSKEAYQKYSWLFGKPPE